MAVILLTNDDGLHARGLEALREALASLGELWVVAPDREQSAASHALTLSRPLRLRRHGERAFSVDGTPTDCVLLAVRGVPGLLDPKPDLVVAGINHGPNMGDDVTYSGTVAAAIEGRLLGKRAMAISLASWEPEHFEAAAAVATGLVGLLLEQAPEAPLLLNVNVPDRPLEEIRGVRVTRLGRRVYNDEIIRKVDPRGNPYYWIGGKVPHWVHDERSDFYAVDNGYVSVTPIHLDLTDDGAIARLQGWPWDRALQVARRHGAGTAEK
jgi:5'-nucleotidase